MAAALSEVFVFKENASVWENISIMKKGDRKNVLNTMHIVEN